jgi:dihydroxyacetone kinase
MHGPAADKPGFGLGEDEMELGLGIHGEHGVRRGKIEPANVIDDINLRDDGFRQEASQR